MGPNGKGKETLKTVNVNIFIRYKEETIRYVRFINKEYYEKNANLDRSALAGKYDQIALLSANGGLHPFSVWYTKSEYRNLITGTFEIPKVPLMYTQRTILKKCGNSWNSMEWEMPRTKVLYPNLHTSSMTGDYVFK